jgi:hypothetical protein
VDAVKNAALQAPGGYPIDRMQPCPECGTVAGRALNGRWWELLALDPPTWTEHTATRCAYAARQRVLSALTDEDRAWLRDRGWNGR